MLADCETRPSNEQDTTLILSNNADRAVIDLENGGRLASLQIDGEEILVTEGTSDTEWGCYPMAPWAGRVRNGNFTWENQARRLPINLPPHAIHGTVFGQEWESIGPTSIRCSLGPDWPWPGEVQSFFELNQGEFVWRIEVHAKTDAFPVVVGWHPWFRRRVAGGDAHLLFEAKEMYVRDDAGIPTGKRRAPTHGPWDDCFTSVKSNPGIHWPHGLGVELNSSCDHWVIYDQPSHAICIEPQSAPPDAFNLGGFEVARPGQPVCHTMRLKWRKT